MEMNMLPPIPGLTLTESRFLDKPRRASLDEFTRQSLKVCTFVVIATESDNLAHSCGYAGKTSAVVVIFC